MTSHSREPTCHSLAAATSTRSRSSAAATPPLPHAPCAHPVIRESYPGDQQIRTQPVDDKLLRSAERCDHVRRFDIEDHLEIGDSPGLDSRLQVTEECLLVTTWALLEAQEQKNDEGAHRPATLANERRCQQRTSAPPKSERLTTQQSGEPRSVQMSSH
jgi:hypothetical protein